MLALTSHVWAQADPAWLRIARADRLLSDRDYGRAMQLYRTVLAEDPDNAEALFGLGRAFKSVGDYSEAEGYLEDSILAAPNLRSPSTEYEIRYELADLYFTQRQFAAYEVSLFQITELAASQPLPPRTVLPEPPVLADSIRESGLDRTLVLYRLPEDGATKAHGDICEFLNGLGRYAAAVEHGTVAVVQRVSTIIDALIQRDPDYEFSTVREALTLATQYPETRNYLGASLLYRDLYYLATGLFSSGYGDRAAEVWRIVVGAADAGIYANRSAIQLRDPQPEPLLVPPR